MRTDTLDRYYNSLPDRPYYKDKVSDRRIIAEKALSIKHRHIQTNSPFKVSWLVYDIDRDGAGIEPLFTDNPVPNITATNPENGHAHYFYGLEREVLINSIKTKDGEIVNPRIRKLPMRFMAAVDIGMTYTLQADTAYNKIMTKNPLHPDWKVDIWRDYLYDLPELAEYVDLTLLKDARKTLPAIGYGRNCLLFDLTLRFAIKEFRKSGWLNNSMYWQSVEGYALFQNKTMFKDYAYGPNVGALDYREVMNIVKSACSWVAQNHTKEGFSEWHAAKGRKGGLKANHSPGGLASSQLRRDRALERNAEIIEYKELYPDTPYKELAEMWDVSLATVQHLRTEYGLSLNELIKIGGYGMSDGKENLKARCHKCGRVGDSRKHGSYCPHCCTSSLVPYKETDKSKPTDSNP